MFKCQAPFSDRKHARHPASVSLHRAVASRQHCGGEPMELTLESAFSPGGMVGHLSYLLLVVSMLMRSLTKLRILVIASALVAITYDTVWLKDPVGVFWETLLVCVNIIQILREWLSERRVTLSVEETDFMRTKLRGISKTNAKRLINLGTWGDGQEGTVLTTEGEEVIHVFYLVSGETSVLCDGQQVATCGPGNFIGEMSVIGRAPASATVVVVKPVRYWKIEAEKLHVLHETDPEIAGALDVGIAMDLRGKIMLGNTRRNKLDA